MFSVCTIPLSKNSVFKCFPSTRKRQAGVSSGLKRGFEKLPFRDGLVWTVKLTVEIKLRFRDGLVWTVGLTVEITLRFLDGLVWTVGLTVEIKLRFRDGLVWTVGLTVEIKLCFLDGLVWTVGLTVAIKLRFQIPPAWCGRGQRMSSLCSRSFSIKVINMRARREGVLFQNCCKFPRRFIW